MGYAKYYEDNVEICNTRRYMNSVVEVENKRAKRIIIVTLEEIRRTRWQFD